MRVGFWEVTDKVKWCPIAHKTYCLCVCQCGRERWVVRGNIKHNRSNSCTHCSQATLWKWKGRILTTAMLMKETGLNRSTFYHRLKRGATFEEAISKPLRTWGRYYR